MIKLATVTLAGVLLCTGTLSAQQPLDLAKVVEALEEARTQYLAGRTDGLVTPRLSHLMKARVGGVPETR